MDSVNHELMVAVSENNLAEVRRLVSVGADVDATNRHGATPLLWACLKGHVQVVKELVERGADMEAKDNHGCTPLHWACSYGHLAVFNELRGHNGVSSSDAKDSNGATTSRGANIRAKDICGNTPLHSASAEGHLALVKALISDGADIRAVNQDGKLPMNQAVTYGKSVVVKYLLQHFYATTRRLPLHELLKDLTFTWIGNPKSLFHDTGPPLREALDENLLGTDDIVEILEYLVDRNPELLSSRDLDGLLPLHVACRRGAPFTIVQSLVNLCKASVKSVTPQGDLSLFLACEMPEPSLDTIFLLMKLYPELVYR
jgi:ankyrin repeat protein